MLSQDGTKNDYYCHACRILCLCTRASMSIEQGSKPVDWVTNVIWTRKPPSQLAPRQGAPCLRVSRISPFPPCLLIAIMKLPTSSNSILCSSWTKYSSVTVTKMHLSASSIRANQSCAIVCPQNCPSLFQRAVCQTVPTSSSAGS